MTKTSGLVGLMTGAVALGVAELTAAVTGPNGAPVVAVGETAINLTPVPVKEFGVKPADLGGTYTVNGAHVVCGNVQTANATVYIIDTVLMPPSS